MTTHGPTIEIAGERLQLLPQRAVYWPTQRMLLIADAHFGKAARFRMHGVPVPGGTTESNLQVLDALLERCAVERLLFLGDFTHGRLDADSATLKRLAQWRAAHGELSVELVIGNHDRSSGALPEALAMATHAEPHDIGPFSLCHHPEVRGGGYVLAGHLHPVVKLYGRGHDRARAPCFVFGEHAALLPAFGAFTGGLKIERQAGDRIWVIAGDNVLALPR